jgi:hypothetical protein
MSMNWILIAIVVWVLAQMFTLILFRMSSDQARSARHDEKDLFEFSDVTITQMGH